MSEEYSNIRAIIGYLIGQRVVDITQHDAEEYLETKQSYIQILFEDGNYLKFFVGDEGFIHSRNEDGTK